MCACMLLPYQLKNFVCFTFNFSLGAETEQLLNYPFFARIKERKKSFEFQITLNEFFSLHQFNREFNSVNGQLLVYEIKWSKSKQMHESYGMIDTFEFVSLRHQKQNGMF